jgi:hypothetical protein
MARAAHASAGQAAQDPADPGALAAQTAQGARMEYGREVVDGFADGGEAPILTRGARPAAEEGRGEAGAEEERQQGEQEAEHGGRKMDVIRRLRQAAKGVGFDRSGDGIWHHK